MKSILPILAFSCFGSCTTYQVMTVASTEVPQNFSKAFVVDNDSLELSYSFSGQNGLIQVTIKNKLDQPLYVDWQRSVLIINDRATSYAPNKVPINGTLGAYTTGEGRDLSLATTGRFNATATLPPEIDFVPPQTYITRQLIGVTNQPIDQLPDSLFRKRRVPAPEYGEAVLKEAFFTANNSPLVFTSYLTLMVGKDSPRPVVCQHRFYVSELVKMNSSPDLLNTPPRSDRFYVVQGARADSAGYGYTVVGGRAVYQQLRPGQ